MNRRAASREAAGSGPGGILASIHGLEKYVRRHFVAGQANSPWQDTGKVPSTRIVTNLCQTRAVRRARQKHSDTFCNPSGTPTQRIPCQPPASITESRIIHLADRDAHGYCVRSPAAPPRCPFFVLVKFTTPRCIQTLNESITRMRSPDRTGSCPPKAVCARTTWT